METEFKLVIVVILIGGSNVLLRGNRNWIFGYRSPRAIKTHETYKMASAYFGIGMNLIGLVYFVILQFFQRLYHSYSQSQHAIIVIAYFLVLAVLIELQLHRKFKDDSGNRRVG